MADRAQRVPENVEGAFFVDTTCIDCDTCRQLAPATFGETGEFSFVRMQPRDEGEESAAYMALVACPTGSIGATDKAAARAAVDELPVRLAVGVSYCVFYSPKSFRRNRY